MNKYFAILILLYASSTLADWSDNPCVLFNEKGTVCNYRVGNHIFSITPAGQISFEKTGLSIVLPEHTQIEEVRDGQIIGNNAYLSLAVTDHESGSTVLVSISLTGKAINWQADLYAFNSSPMLITENAIYIGGIGTVAKINLHSGKTEWLHNNLYEEDTQAFNGFNKPYLDSGNVVYPESKVSFASYDGERSVVVNIDTGKIVSK